MNRAPSNAELIFCPRDFTRPICAEPYYAMDFLLPPLTKDSLVLGLCVWAIVVRRVLKTSTSRRRRSDRVLLRLLLLLQRYTTNNNGHNNNWP